ncbi:MAG: murein biosynthesis integral membrane protein MurJ [Terriglobia bacterium]|nr:MAG: murein biosynthesis integral membrane protein MurJ [Terriglobia bacterium]
MGAGILLTRILGLVRQRVFSKYFGLLDAADAFGQALRIPNFLQNLFGEGVLSASFIPVYARLLAERDEREAGRVAGAIAAILALTTSVLVLIGVLATPYLIYAIAPGFHGAKRDLTIRLVRILFPGVGMLVMSAWCLGILNSHRKFFLSYSAGVVWNLAMIATLIAFRRLEPNDLAVVLAWGAVAGSMLQFLVQLPVVLRLARGLRLRLARDSAHVRQVLRSFGPVFVSRGVVQISAYVDSLLASLLGQGAVAGLMNAQTLYLLPVSLFGMSVSAAELPAMSGALGERDEVAAVLRERLNAGLRRIAFFIVPSAMAFLALGDVITAALFQTGRFTGADTQYVWGILAGSAVGLLASTLGRLYASTYYALRDTRTPLRYAVIRVLLTTGLGYFAALPLPVWLGLNPRWGVAGLTASAGVAGWVEFLFLRKTLQGKIGHTGLPLSLIAKLWLSAIGGAMAAWAVKLAIGTPNPILAALLILAPYGLVYLGAAYFLRVRECVEILRGVLRLSLSSL